jgi:hypothetical protein
VIIFSELRRGLFRVPAQGGEPSALEMRSRGEFFRRWPWFLPGGRQFLFTMRSNDPNVTGIYVGSLGSKENKRLVGDLSGAAYVEGPAGEGYLLFVRAFALMAQKLDLSRSEVSGEAFAVAEKVGADLRTAEVSYSVSGNGILVYDASAGGGLNQLTWIDRNGKRLGTIGEPGAVRFPAISPDEKQAVATIIDTQQNGDLWILDVQRGISNRFTFHPRADFDPIWSPDGKSIAFSSSRDGFFDLYRKSVSGGGQEELLVKTANQKVPTDWSMDGRFLIYHEDDRKTKDDLMGAAHRPGSAGWSQADGFPPVGVQ